MESLSRAAFSKLQHTAAPMAGATAPTPSKKPDVISADPTTQNGGKPIQAPVKKPAVSIPYRPGQEGQRVHRADRGRKRRGPRGHSKYRGVCITKTGKWRAVIYVERKQHYLGVYETELQAAKAYDRAAKRHFGTTAKLNFPEEADEGTVKRQVVGTPHQPLVLAAAPSELQLRQKAFQDARVIAGSREQYLGQQATMDSLTREAYVQEQRKLSAIREIQIQQLVHAQIRSQVAPFSQAVQSRTGVHTHQGSAAQNGGPDKAGLYRIVHEGVAIGPSALFKGGVPASLHSADAASWKTSPETFRISSNISPGRSAARAQEQLAFGAAGLVHYGPAGFRASVDGLQHVPVSHVTLLPSPTESFSAAEIAVDNGSHGAKRRFSSEPYANGFSYGVKRPRQQYELASVNELLASDAWRGQNLGRVPAYSRVGTGHFNELDILSSAAVLVDNPAQKMVHTGPSQPAIIAQHY